MQVTANGLQINYEITGPANAPVVMLSNSLASDLTMWDAQMPSLTERYRVLRYDTRGHGGTQVTQGAYTLDLLADDVLALLAALGIRRCHFVGLSMGGMIAQTLAVRGAPELLSITLCNTSSAMPNPAIWDERVAHARSAGMAALAAPTIDRWLSKGFQAREARETARVSRMIANTPVDGYCGCGLAIAQLALTGRLAGVGLPTLIIVGKDDPGTPVSASEAIHAKINGSRLVVLDDAMHLSNIEQPKAFNKALRAFLDAQP